MWAEWQYSPAVFLPEPCGMFAAAHTAALLISALSPYKSSPGTPRWPYTPVPPDAQLSAQPCSSYGPSCYPGRQFLVTSD